MWLPLTSRTRGGPSLRRMVSVTCPTQGPAALTRTRAVTLSRRPRAFRISRQTSLALGANASGAGADHGAALGGVERVQHDEPRIVNPAIGILEAVLVAALERLADDVVGEIERMRRRQDLAAAEMIVDEQPQPQHQRRAHAGLRRQHEAQGPDDVRGHAQQHFALVQRLAHQLEGAMFEIAQAAMDQLGGGRGGSGGEIVLLDQEHAQAPAGGVAGDAGPIDAAADNCQVELGHRPNSLEIPIHSMRGEVPALKRHVTRKLGLNHYMSRSLLSRSNTEPECPPPACWSWKAIPPMAALC